MTSKYTNGELYDFMLTRLTTVHAQVYQLAVDLALKRKFGRVVVAFFDDDPQKWHKHIHNVPVVGMPECLFDGWIEKLDEVIIAMPGAPPDRIAELDQLLRKTGLRSYTVFSPISGGTQSDRVR